MASLSLQDAQKIVEKLGTSWRIESGILKGSFTFSDFQQALDFTNCIGSLAEDLWHHPDIFLSWGKVEVSLVTHDEGGITAKDIELAALIQKKKQSDF